MLLALVFTAERIVLWDTIIQRMTPSELLFVMGQEMGHYALGHIWLGIVFNGVLLTASFYGAYRTAGPVLERWGTRLAGEPLVYGDRFKRWSA